MPNYSEPKRNQHTHSFTSTESPDQADTRGLAALKKGVKQWIPDLASMIGSIPDAAYYAARRIAQGQSNQSTPSLGVGPALARYAQSRLPNPPALRTQTEISPLEDEDPRTSLTRLVNPLMWTNPLKLAKSPEAVSLMAGLTGVPGGIGVIKEKGGNWLSGSVEGALSGLKSPYVKGYQEAVERYGPETAHHYAARPPVGAGALNNWIDRQLTRYVKNEMATLEDPIRALAERGVLHVDPTQLRRGSYTVHTSGNGYQKLAQNQDAAKWETAADHTIMEAPYREHLPLQGEAGNEPVGALRRLGGDFAVANPDASAFGWNRGTSTHDLGFNHLIDELSNAINPDSGLPRHLQFPADRLDRVSVPQAVERVAEINAWRKALKAEADAKLANNAATVLHKEYPDKGFKWVELKNPAKMPEGHGTVRDGNTWYAADPQGRAIGPGSSSEEGAIRAYHEGQGTLRDALKYEGDTMGHCVGGYCDDVLEGRSRIFSLRDAKGEPHVTVETAPHPILPLRYPEDRAKLTNLYEQQYGVTPTDGQLGQFWVNGDYRQFMPNDIVQIKGKSNNKPNPEYIPYVQDFVKTQGPWREVGDLHNTNLWKHPKTGQFHTRDELKSNPELEEAYSSRNLDENGQRFAEGGLVRQIGGAYLYAE